MGTRYEGPEHVRRALDTWIKVARAHDAVQASLASQLRTEGLTTGQLGVLEALLHLGPMVQSRLAEKLLKSPSNITTILDNLERDGLIRRTRGRRDRRAVEISLTEGGRELIEDAFPRHAERITDLMDALSETEQRRLGALCRKLGRAVTSGQRAR